MKARISFAILQRKLPNATTRFWCTWHGLLCATILLTGHFSANGQAYPLPPWSIYGGGINSTWDGASTRPDNVQLAVTLFGPPVMPNQYVTASAISSQEVMRIEPATTYTLTFSAVRSAGTAACVALMEMEDGNSVINSTIISSITWRGYTNTFTTGGSNDGLVGRPLNLRFALMKSAYQTGTASAAFTNIQLRVSTTRPSLMLRNSGVDLIELQWPTNYFWYALEQTTNLQAGVWEGLTNLPGIQGDHYRVQVETDERQRFFRLRD